MGLTTLDKKLQGKLKLLKLLDGNTKTVVEQRDSGTIERHLNTIQKKLSEVQDLKLGILELKLEEGEDMRPLYLTGVRMSRRM